MKKCKTYALDFGKSSSRLTTKQLETNRKVNQRQQTAAKACMLLYSGILIEGSDLEVVEEFLK